MTPEEIKAIATAVADEITRRQAEFEHRRLEWELKRMRESAEWDRAYLDSFTPGGLARFQRWAEGRPK